METLRATHRQTAVILGMTLASLLWFGTNGRAQDTYNVVYSFVGGSNDGANPFGNLIEDSLGNLYGTTESGGDQYCGPLGNNSNHGCGTVFELVNSSGTYTEKVLHSFAGESGDGYRPYAGLIMDGAGDLFGTTQYGGTYQWGTVYELVNSSGTYTEKLLYSFGGSSGDGQIPLGGLIVDSSGNLYGTTRTGGDSAYNGIVFELMNSSGTYTEKILHVFGGTSSDGALPNAGLIMDSSGNLYGTTEAGGASANCQDGCGAVFELVNSSGSYTEQLLYSFVGGSSDGASPYATLIMDSSGNLYSTTVSGGASNAGTVFELVKSSGSYTEQLLHSFAGGSADGANPYDALILDSFGNLYGTTEAGGAPGLGTVFELVNSSGSYTEQLLYQFPAGGNLGSGPYAGLLDVSGNLYGATYGGGSNACPSTCGVVFGLTAQQGSSGLLGSNNTFTGTNIFTQAITGSVTGNAGTVTNGVYTTGSYADPGWITSLSAAKITGTVASALTAASATTAGALAATPTQCGSPTFATGIAANGNANCLQPASTNLSDSSTLVRNNQANSFAGGKQTLAPSAAGYASLNLPGTGAAPSTPAMGDLWLTNADTHPKFRDSTNTTQSVAFLSDISSAGSGLLGSNNAFTGINTFSQPINGNLNGNAATATSALTATSATTAASATTATTALTATTAGSATTAGALAATPTQCGSGSFATGIAANGNANCAQPAGSIGASQILFSSAGIFLWNGAFMGISAPSLTEASIEQVVALSGHVTAMQCYSQTAPKNSSETFTLRLNGASTAGVCTIAAGASKGSVTGLNLAVTAGNLVDINVGGPTTLSAATVAAAVGP
jgi:uncharacterized repeat protein (TIGR03803 family)